jgi:predicted permease
VNSVLLRPLPVAHIDRLVALGRRNPLLNSHGGLQAAEVFSLEDRHDLFDALAGYRSVNLNLTGSGEPRHIAAVATTGEFFDVFGVHPFAGRFYDRDDERTGATSVVVLSYGLWRDLTGADRHAIGRTLRLNDSSYTIIGVAPPRFEYPVGAQVWTSRTIDIFLNRRATDTFLYAGAVVPTVARMRPDMTLPRLQSELTAAMREWATKKPQFYSMRAPRPIEARGFITAWSGQLRSILLLLIGAVALVLAIACANVGSLILLRTTGRAREIAVRMALGGSRAVIVRQLGYETLILVALGGLLGVLVANALIAAVGRFVGQRVPELAAIHVDPFVLGCAAGVMVLAAAACSVGPAFHAAGTDPRNAFGAMGSRGQSASIGRNRLLGSAVVAQIAIALMLSLGCSLAVRSVVRLLAVNPGFDPSHVVAAKMVLPFSKYPDTTLAGAVRSLALHEHLLAELRGTRGIEAASTVDIAPFGYSGALEAAMHRVQVTSQIGSDTRSAVAPNLWDVDADYFNVMGIPFLAGRGFTGQEQWNQVRAYPKQLQTDVVIDQLAARRLFPGQIALGKVIGPWAPGFRVVGIVGSVKQSDLSSPADDGAIYFPAAATQNQQTIVVRTDLPFGTAASLIRHAVHDADPELALFDIEPLTAIVSRSAGPREVASWLLVGFAALSVGLALLGIYGVLSYATSQRRMEIAIRLALGAPPNELLTRVMRSAAILTATGVVTGAVGYLALQRGLAAIAYAVDATDPVAIASTALLVAAIALMASLPPALRAARIDPVESLKAD